MKAFGGGDLLDEELRRQEKALTVNQCLHYALTRPGVAADVERILLTSWKMS